MESARHIMSQELLSGRAPNGRSFLVTDEAGKIALVYPFKDAIHGSNLFSWTL